VNLDFGGKLWLAIVMRDTKIPMTNAHDEVRKRAYETIGESELRRWQWSDFPTLVATRGGFCRMRSFTDEPHILRHEGWNHLAAAFGRLEPRPFSAMCLSVSILSRTPEYSLRGSVPVPPKIGGLGRPCMVRITEFRPSGAWINTVPCIINRNRRAQNFCLFKFVPSQNGISATCFYLFQPLLGLNLSANTMMAPRIASLHHPET
jgi:hypothetical protein